MIRIKDKTTQQDIVTLFNNLVANLAEALDIDLDYFSEIGVEWWFRSQRKPITALFKGLIDEGNIVVDEETLTPIDRATTIISAHFLNNWVSVIKAYATEYKPLENYSMKEKETPNLHTITETEASTKSNTKSKMENFLYPYDSTEKLPASETSSDVTTTGLKADNKGKFKEDRTGTRELERAGNIGTMTSQKMLSEELEVRQFDFLERMFKDVDRILCRNYMGC